MSTYSLTSIKTAWNKAWSILPWQSEATEYDLLMWSSEILGLIKVPKYMKDYTYVGEIKEYRGELPCNIDLFNGVAAYVDGTLDECDDESIDRLNFIPMRYSSDIYHKYCSKLPPCSNCEQTYTVNDNCIFTSFEEGLFLLSYTGLAQDKEGFPLVSIEEKVLLAVAYYILYRIAFQKIARGEISQYVLEKLEQEKLWYVAKAQTRIPTYDEGESLKNIWIRMIPKITEHKTGYASATDSEQIYTNTYLGGKYLNTASVTYSYTSEKD